MKGIVKPFQAPTNKAPWIGVNLVEKAKSASKKPAETQKAK